MRIRALKNAAAILDVMMHHSVTREQLADRLETAGHKLSKDALNNLLLDLQELGWVERRPVTGTVPELRERSSVDSGLSPANRTEYRIGLGLALIYKRALDAEKREAREIMERLEMLTNETTDYTDYTDKEAAENG